MAYKPLDIDTALTQHINRLEKDIFELRKAFFYHESYHGIRIVLKRDKHNLFKSVQQDFIKNPGAQKTKEGFEDFIQNYFKESYSEDIDAILESDAETILDELYVALPRQLI